jgi:glycerol-1-phosphate dehydrogenase [NAD(P)+]
LLQAESRAVLIADTLDGAEAEIVDALDLGDTFTIVSDRETHAVLGARVERALASRFTVHSLILDAPHADAETVTALAAAIPPGTSAIVAVGSGTLNDLGKAAALIRDIPQLVFATAPSMNGYTSVSASITEDGVKRSIRARTPVGVFLDLEVLARAPVRLRRAGLGDSACRPTAQADWLLSHLLLDRPYREAPFALLAADEVALFADPAALVAGDLEATRALARTLVLSGFGMTLSGGSFPASQGEHLLSHYLEAFWPPGVPHAYHGEQVGVCTLAMARLQEQLLARATPPVLAPSTLTEAELIARHGPLAGAAFWIDIAAKLVDVDALNSRLATQWDAIRSRIATISLPSAQLEQLLGAAGCPVVPADIGCPDALFADALAHAHELRDRYTFLDLASACKSEVRG